MSRLETAFQAGGGVRVLAGDTPVLLSKDALRIVARWVIKGALVLHEAFAYQTGRVTVPSVHFQALKDGAPHDSTSIDIGGVDAAGRDIMLLRPVQLAHAGEEAGYVMAMSIGYLLAIIAAPTVSTAIWSRPIPPSLLSHFDLIWPLPDALSAGRGPAT